MVNKSKTQLSVVIPVYNEEKNLEKLYVKLQQVLRSITNNHEIIFVDDGSDDNSLGVLKKIHKKDQKIKVISFRRNFGQTAAMSAGFDHALGKTIITMDADLQNDPKDIPKLLIKIGPNCDVVSGWRRKRKDDFVTRKIPSIVANFLISTISGVKLHDYGCSLKAYKKEILEDIKLYGEMHRFIPVMAAGVGARIGEVEVLHHKRKYGKSKYGLDRILRVILDLMLIKFFVSYQKSPIQLFGKIGIYFSMIGVAVFSMLIFERLFFGQPLSTRPLFLTSIFMTLIGFQFITFGVLAEILIRIYYEGQGKKTYIIEKIIKLK